MTIKLITGLSGDRHITPLDDATLYKNIVGSGIVFLTRPTLSIVNNNQVNLSPCELLINGRYIRVTTTEIIRIDNGIAGSNRRDYIYLEFVRSGNVENVVVKVQKNTQPYENLATFGDSNGTKAILGNVYVSGISLQSATLVSGQSMTIEQLMTKSQSLESGKASTSTVNSLSSRLSTAESNINNKASTSTVNSLSSRVSSLESFKNGQADYITSVSSWSATGITGGKIIKYKSGRCEIFGQQSLSTNFNVSRGSAGYSTPAHTLNFPVTFRRAPMVFATMDDVINLGFVGYTNATTTKSTFAIMNIGSGSGSHTCKINWHIVGEI